MILTSVLTLLVFLVTFFGTRSFIGWSRRRNILDIPNERSSHTEPVPVGAGIFIAISVLAAFAARTYFGQAIYGGSFPGNLSAAYLAGGCGIAAISWLDDVKGVNVAIRFAVHSACAALVIFAVFRDVAQFVAFGWIFVPLTLLWIVGLTNAYNFMDGIDGIAGVQGGLAGLGWALTGYLLGDPLLSSLGSFVCISCIAFLLFNREPAKVFMGDVGSAFLGFTLSASALLALAGRSSDGLAAAGFWPLMLMAVSFVWPFVFDSSFTFARRVINGEKVWLPHRSHLYQRMVRAGRTHTNVTIVYGSLALFTGGIAIVSGGQLSFTLPALAVVASILLWLGFDPGNIASVE